MSCLPEFSPALIQRLCDPKTGAGVDGIIVVMTSKKADALMRFYNSDGFEAEMCGNGVRCLMQYMRQKLFYPRLRCLLETKKRDILLSTDGSEVCVQMGNMDELGWDISYTHNKTRYTMHHIDSGVPHLVIFVDDVERIDVAKVGRYFRNHARFKPQGTNVNFVSLAQDRGGLTGSIRTYERGVEAETLACGTGVTAAGYVLYKKLGYRTPITLRVRSGQTLCVAIEPRTTGAENIYLKGPADWVSDCTVAFDTEKQTCSLSRC